MATKTLQTTDAVRDVLTSGIVQPGEFVSQERLCGLLGVSRTPIRTALSALAAEGLLTYYPNRGYMVAAIDIDEMLVLYDVRAQLEGLACYYTALRPIDPADVKEVSDILEEGDVLAAATDIDFGAYRRFNEGFHRWIICASNSPSLLQLWEQTARIYAHGTGLAPPENFSHDLRRHHEHRSIFDRISSGDAEGAKELMISHVSSAKEEFYRSTERHGIRRRHHSVRAD
jgi:GntR family transcriptional regulator, vanillate catabolism transcriptional regulator